MDIKHFLIYRAAAAGLFLLLAISTPVLAEEAAEGFQDCLVSSITGASDEMTLGELKRQCRERGLVEHGKVEKSAITQRVAEESATGNLAFVITPHKPNYLIAGYNTSDPNLAPYQEAFPNEDFSFQDTELKFQLSLKFLLVDNLFGNNGDIYAAYTNRSFWQAFNRDISSPFRETNHEPEAWIRFDTDWKLLGLTNRAVSLGVSHQSNGRSGPLSRSWNRVYANFIFERDNFYFGIKPWWRIPEDSEDDDNPDITDYLGNFEFQGVYKRGRHNFGLMVRNNLDTSDNNGAVQLDWSFPLYKHLRGYVQWFNGYGESLIDYDHYTNTFGAGIQLTDWL